jgi:DUF1680 family protein
VITFDKASFFFGRENYYYCKTNNPIMKRTILLLALSALYINLLAGTPQYVSSRAPLKESKYLELPLGSIKAEGWLQEMLLSQKSGMTGHLDELYPLVMGDDNGWLGGDGDQWERGPYWLDGLVPLAYILDDATLKAKAQKWIESILAHQREDGYIGPQKNYPPKPGVQRNNSSDWWPRMVVLKVMKQYYSATGDKRVLDFLTKYFHYQLSALPDNPLDKWTYWALHRSCDNIDVVLWLYDITGDKSLLDLASLIRKQSFNYTDKFLNTDFLQLNDEHGVNLAQGFKFPAICYRQNGENDELLALKKGFKDLDRYDGWATGMFGADESLHGKDPTQGSELCAVVEMMFSLERILQITGDTYYADRLEKVAFNALPTQISDDFMSRQYFQQANQVECSYGTRNFNVNHRTDNMFGLLNGYPCCTSNLHQGWPKFVENLWYATEDGGAAAMVYSPCLAEIKVGPKETLIVEEETSYPFNETITFNVSFKEKKCKSASFPMEFRIPSWCKEPSISINGENASIQVVSGMARLARTWKAGDKVELTLPMHVSTSRWYENSLSVERGPLVYALKIAEKWQKVPAPSYEKNVNNEYYWEVIPQSDWNYGIPDFRVADYEHTFKVKIDKDKVDAAYPWNLENAPIEIHLPGKKIPSWQMYNGNTGPIPYSILLGLDLADGNPETDLTLIPYGCTTLRISEFPILATR